MYQNPVLCVWVQSGYTPRKDLPCDKILAVFQFLRLAFPLPTNGWQNIEEIPKTWNLKSMKLSQRRLNALDNFNIWTLIHEIYNVHVLHVGHVWILRRIPLNVRAISAKNIYQKTPHSTVTFSMLKTGAILFWTYMKRLFNWNMDNFKSNFLSQGQLGNKSNDKFFLSVLKMWQWCKYFFGNLIFALTARTLSGNRLKYFFLMWAL